MALPQESNGRLEALGCRLIYTGVGKVNAAIGLAKELGTHNYRQVINVGSAGSHTLPVLQLVQCTRFVQHDMNVQAFGYAPYQTPQESVIALEPATWKTGLDQHTLYTGDAFVERADLGYPVIDMEGYALAKTCQTFQLPFLCLKFISDNANEKAALSWEASLEHGAQLATQFLGDYFSKS